MTSLPQVLHEAAAQRATEIVLEPGRSPRVFGELGASDLGPALREEDLFAALSQVLPPEQQAELAVGSVVEFQVDVESGRWTLITELKGDKINVRGRLQERGLAVEVGTPLDLPPLEPFVPELGHPAPKAPLPVFRADVPKTPWDAQREQDVDDDGPPLTALDELDAPPLALERRPSSWRLRNPEPSFVDFELRSPGLEDAAGGDAYDEPDACELHDAEMELPASAPVLPSGALQAVAKQGTVTLVRGPFEPIIDALRREHTVAVIDELDSPMLSRTWNYSAHVWILRLEDPSPLLGWILRRLEEGACVVVESRARTTDGAVRVLLGTCASERAQRWLDLHRCMHLTFEAGTWRVNEPAAETRMSA